MLKIRLQGTCKGKNKRNKKVNNAGLVNNKKADNNKKKLNFNELIKKIFSISKRTSLEKLKKFKTLLRKVSEYRIFNININSACKVVSTNGFNANSI